MLLQEKSSTTTIEIEDLETLFNPLKNEIEGKIQEGQEEQDPQSFAGSIPIIAIKYWLRHKPDFLEKSGL
jgi:hypothetical protein